MRGGEEPGKERTRRELRAVCIWGMCVCVCVCGVHGVARRGIAALQVCRTVQFAVCGKLTVAEEVDGGHAPRTRFAGAASGASHRTRDMPHAGRVHTVCTRCVSGGQERAAEEGRGGLVVAETWASIAWASPRINRCDVIKPKPVDDDASPNIHTLPPGVVLVAVRICRVAVGGGGAVGAVGARPREAHERMKQQERERGREWEEREVA